MVVLYSLLFFAMMRIKIILPIQKYNLNDSIQIYLSNKIKEIKFRIYYAAKITVIKNILYIDLNRIDDY